MARVENFTHYLVKSLSSSEKSFIKKQIKGNEVHLISLLDDLYKTKICSNKEFRKLFNTKKYAKNLTQNKNYLRQKIINALILYKCGRIPKITKRQQLNVIDVLVEKGFLKKTIQLIDELLNECKKYEAFTIGYDLAVRARRIHSNNITFSLKTTDIKRYANERRYCLEQLTKIEQLANLNDIHLMAMEVDEKIKAITTQLKILNLEIEELPADYPYTAKRIFYYTKSELAKYKNEQEKRIFYLAKLVKLYNQYPHFIEREYTKYLVDSINYLNSLIVALDFKCFFVEHAEIIKQVKTLQNTAYVAENSRVYVLQFLFPQNALSNSGNFIAALKFANSYWSFLNTNKTKLSIQFVEASIIQISIAYLYNKNYTKPLDIIEPHIKSKNYQHQYNFRLIQLVSHYYLKNDFLMEHLFNSFVHFLKANDKKDAAKGIYILKKYIYNKMLIAMKNTDLEDFVWIKFHLLK